MLKSSSRNQRHKTTHAAPPGGVVVPGKHTQNPPQTQLNLQQAHPPVRRPITIPPMKAETIPAPVTSSPKDAPPKRPCLFVVRSEEHTSELQSLMRISYAVFCLKKKKYQNQHNYTKVHIKINSQQPNILIQHHPKPM